MRNILLSLIAVSLLFFTPASSLSQSKKVKVLVRAPFEASTGVGLLISSRGTDQIYDIELDIRNDGSTVVTFPVATQSLPKDTMASAVVSSAEGEVAFGTVVPVIAAGASRSWLSIPQCKGRSAETLTGEQLSLIDTLVEVRNSRAKIARKKIDSLLSEGLGEKINRLESGFGLSQNELISSELEPFELVDRLSRLLSALKSHRAHKARSKAAEAEARAEEEAAAEEVESSEETEDIHG